MRRARRNAAQISSVPRSKEAPNTTSAKREAVACSARRRELDLEPSLGDGQRLTNQLVQPLFGERAIALYVNVEAVRSAWRIAIDQHAKSTDVPA